jgi:hypothetical protein
MSEKKKKNLDANNPAYRAGYKLVIVKLEISTISLSIGGTLQ